VRYRSSASSPSCTAPSSCLSMTPDAPAARCPALLPAGGCGQTRILPPFQRQFWRVPRREDVCDAGSVEPLRVRVRPRDAHRCSPRARRVSAKERAQSAPLSMPPPRTLFYLHTTQLYEKLYAMSRQPRVERFSAKARGEATYLALPFARLFLDERSQQSARPRSMLISTVPG